MYAKNMIYSGDATVHTAWGAWWPCSNLGPIPRSLVKPIAQWLWLQLRIQVVDVTPDMDISKQIASGETHRPVLRGKSAKDVHWYVTSACDLMVKFTWTFDFHGS